MHGNLRISFRIFGFVGQLFAKLQKPRKTIGRNFLPPASSCNGGWLLIVFLLMDCVKNSRPLLPQKSQAIIAPISESCSDELLLTYFVISIAYDGF